MAAAATARKPAPAPAPPAKAAAPARKPAPARKAPARKPAPARKAPARKATATRKAAAPARKAPARRTAPTRRPGGQLIPIAVGTASAVRRLPDSSLMVRMTQGRAWIAVLGTLLAGIVALNVITLSFAATAGQVDQNIQALDQENTVLRSRDAQKSSTARIRSEAGALGLSAASIDEVGYVQADAGDVATAAHRLAAAAGY